MDTILITLHNSVFWSQGEDAKHYLDTVRVWVADLPFHNRPVRIAFARGPGFDFSVVDMDKLAVEYLKLRGINLPDEILQLAEADPPPPGTFSIPGRSVRKLSKSLSAASAPRRQRKKRCARCHQLEEPSGDWFGKLCPSCADATEGTWVCQQCGQSGEFEEMGGEGAADPVCCGVPCHHIKCDDS